VRAELRRANLKCNGPQGVGVVIEADLDLPVGLNASLGLTIGDPTVVQAATRYRALIFLNGWNRGQHIADVGPQNTFVLPTGILKPNGPNTLTLAVTSDGGPGNGLEHVTLTNLVRRSLNPVCQG